MKIFNSLILISCFVSSLVLGEGALNNQITYYGCPEECETQQNPACGKGTLNTKYFSALSTKFPGVKNFCGQYAIVLVTNGSTKLVKTKIVDTCSNCDPFHVDLSSYAFETILNKKDGVADIIWGIYSSNGTKLSGPFYRTVDNAAERLGLSKDAYISAFENSARSLAQSHNINSFLSTSSPAPKPTTTRKTTTINKTTYVAPKPTTTQKPTYVAPKPTTTQKPTYVAPKPTTTQKPTYVAPKSTTAPKPTYVAPKPTTVNSKPSSIVPTPPKQITITSLPPKHTSTVVLFASKEVSSSVTAMPINNVLTTVGSIPETATTLPTGTVTVSPLATPSTGPIIQPIQPDVSNIDRAVNEKDKKEDNSSNVGATVGIVTALGGTVLGAAGVGLIFMKKNNPSTYEDLKQKFPEAFSQVKRGLSRRATQLKRRVTQRTPVRTEDTTQV